ncbi:hypothetical protein TNCV_3657511 [Trichonephila clavipes]|nr:hypothetical protein TNCV_3657511 [Trichonephila clavipes]
MQALLKAKKRWASGQLELEHPSFNDNDPNASGHASSNYEKNAKTWERSRGIGTICISDWYECNGKKSFSKHIKILSEENSEMKHQILEVARNIVRKQHLDLNDEKKKEIGVLDITVSLMDLGKSGSINHCTG